MWRPLNDIGIAGAVECQERGMCVTFIDFKRKHSTELIEGSSGGV